MKSDWQISTLGEIADITKLAGYEFTKHIKYDDSGEIIALRALNVVDGHLDLSNIKRIAKSISDDLPRSKLYKSDLLLTYTGSKLGDTALVDADNKYHLAPNVCRLRVNEEEDSYYLYLYLRSKEFSRHLDNFKVGSGQPTVPMKNIRKIPIPLPSINARRNIGDIYRAFDDKIELNRKMNQTLEEMAQTLFKSWFVNFDPVHVKAGCKTNDELEAVAKEFGITKEVLELFPSEFVESEMGMIPLGWEIKIMNEVISVRDGTHDSPKPKDEGYPLVTSKHIKNGELDLKTPKLISKEDFNKVNKRSIVEQHDILIGMIGTIGDLYLVSDTKVEYAIKNIGLFKVSEKKELSGFLYYWLDTERMRNYIRNRLAGTTQKYISLTELRKLPILSVGDAVIEKFNEILTPILEMKKLNFDNIEFLEETRDTLLPKFLSGELDVSQVEV